MEHVLALNVLHEFQKVTDRMLLVPLGTSLVPHPTCSWTSRYMSVEEPGHWGLAQSPVAGTLCVCKLFVGNTETKQDQLLPSHVFGEIWPQSAKFWLGFFPVSYLILGNLVHIRRHRETMQDIFLLNTSL